MIKINFNEIYKNYDEKFEEFLTFVITSQQKLDNNEVSLMKHLIDNSK